MAHTCNLHDARYKAIVGNSSFILGNKLISPQPKAESGNLNHGEGVLGEFVVADSNASEVFELA